MGFCLIPHSPQTQLPSPYRQCPGKERTCPTSFQQMLTAPARESARRKGLMWLSEKHGPAQKLCLQGVKSSYDVQNLMTGCDVLCPPSKTTNTLENDHIFYKCIWYQGGHGSFICCLAGRGNLNGKQISPQTPKADPRMGHQWSRG